MRNLLIVLLICTTAMQSCTSVDESASTTDAQKDLFNRVEQDRIIYGFYYADQPVNAQGPGPLTDEDMQHLLALHELRKRLYTDEAASATTILADMKTVVLSFESEQARNLKQQEIARDFLRVINRKATATENAGLVQEQLLVLIERYRYRDPELLAESLVKYKSVLDASFVRTTKGKVETLAKEIDAELDKKVTSKKNVDEQYKQNPKRALEMLKTIE
jgi:hypothetical protein